MSRVLYPYFFFRNSWLDTRGRKSNFGKSDLIHRLNFLGMDSDWSNGCLLRDGPDSPAWVFGSCGGRVGSGMVEDVGGLSDLPLIGSSDVYMDN